MSRIVLPAEPLISGPTALRPWRDSDAARLVEVIQDPEIPRWTSVPSPYREADARMFLNRRHDDLHTGSEASFAIVETQDTDHGLVGGISLLRFAWPERRCEVGYWLAREARGHGHATRAVTLISAWAVNALGMERIELHAATGNVASQRVAERAGFTREAVMRSHLESKQGRLDMVMFALLPANA